MLVQDFAPEPGQLQVDLFVAKQYVDVVHSIAQALVVGVDMKFGQLQE